MKRIKSTVNYTVPSWNFCNSDNLVGGELTKHMCRFCDKGRSGAHCRLYDAPLSTKGEFIYKVPACVKATAGFASVVDEPAPAPTIDPKDIMKQTLDLYEQTVKDLVAQNYPRALAEKAARKIILGK